MFQGPQTMIKMHQICFSIYLNHLDIYLTKEKAVKHT
jgi:hypothetical protein